MKEHRTIGSLIETYESQNLAGPDGDPIATLNSLVEEHGLKQSDLSEIGSQGVVSESELFGFPNIQTIKMCIFILSIYFISSA